MSSSRGYFEISTNLSLTKVISPLTLVVATIAAWLSAKLVSARSLIERSSAMPVFAYLVTSQAVTQMPTLVRPRFTTTTTVAAPGGESHAATVVSSVTTMAAHSENPRTRTNRPSKVTTPYSAQTVMPRGSSRSTRKMIVVRPAAMPISRRSEGVSFACGGTVVGISNESGAGRPIRQIGIRWMLAAPRRPGKGPAGEKSTLGRELFAMKTILVVDDEPLIRWAIREVLEDAGYAVVE